MCAEPRCPNVATARGRCDQHRKQLERERSARRRTGDRTAAAIRTYHSAKWINTRDAILTRDPICKVCDNRLSEQVDHITPLSRGGAEYAPTNLRGICVPATRSRAPAIQSRHGGERR